MQLMILWLSGLNKRILFESVMQEIDQCLTIYKFSTSQQQFQPQKVQDHVLIAQRCLPVPAVTGLMYIH
jgi:hypothetical protein